jgi:hypothetical protein
MTQLGDIKLRGISVRRADMMSGLTRAKAAVVAGLRRATVQRYVAAYRDGGPDGLRHWSVTGPVSDLAGHVEIIKNSLTASPVRTVADQLGIELRVANYPSYCSKHNPIEHRVFPQ